MRGACAYVHSTADGVRELRRPQHLGSVDVRAELSPWASASLAMTHTGASLDRDFSTWPATQVDLDGFRLWRANVDIAPTPRWKLRLGVENLLDENYTTVFGYRSPGLTAMIKVIVEL